MIEKVEEDFYEKFNELNIEDAYDVVCYKQTPTMRHIPKRICEPVFMYRSRGDMASHVTLLLGSGSIGARRSAMDFYRNDRQLVTEKKNDYEILQELMEEFTSSDAELRSMAQILTELKYRLENYNRN